MPNIDFDRDARLAQLVEQPLYTGKVGGSNPSARTDMYIICPHWGLFHFRLVKGVAGTHTLPKQPFRNNL